MLETITSGIIDQFPHQLLNRRVLVNILTGCFFFLTGLPLTMNVRHFLCKYSYYIYLIFKIILSNILRNYLLCKKPWIYKQRQISLNYHLDII